MSVEKMLKKGYKAVKQRWDTKEERDRQREEERYSKLSLEEARLDKKLRLRKLETRVRKKKIKAHPLGRLLQEAKKPKHRNKKKGNQKKKKKEEGFTLPPL